MASHLLEKVAQDGTNSLRERVYRHLEAALREGQRNVMIGIKNDEVVYVPFCNAIKSDKPVKKELINVLGILSI